MKGYLNEAMAELSEKSPFICTSCGHPADISVRKRGDEHAINTTFHDRFSEAVMEESEKSSFACTSCGHDKVMERSKLH